MQTASRWSLPLTPSLTRRRAPRAVFLGFLQFPDRLTLLRGATWQGAGMLDPWVERCLELI
jgi:hypothetical protein